MKSALHAGSAVFKVSRLAFAAIAVLRSVAGLMGRIAAVFAILGYLAAPAHAYTVVTISGNAAFSTNQPTCAASVLGFTISGTPLIDDGGGRDYFVVRITDGSGTMIASNIYNLATGAAAVNVTNARRLDGTQDNAGLGGATAVTSLPLTIEVYETTSTAAPATIGATPLDTRVLDATALTGLGLTNCAALPAFTGGGGESTLLDNQQSTFTPLIINQHSYSLVDGVGSNLDGQFNGNGVSPFVSPNGFAMSTTGMANWMAQRETALRAARDREAFDLFASELERRQRAAELAASAFGAGEARRPVHTDALAGGEVTGGEATGEAPRHLSAYQSEAGAAEDRSAYAADVTVEDFTEIAAAPPSWNAWVKGSWTVYDGDGSSFDGHVVNILGGVDYRLSDDLILGLLAGYGVAEFDTVTGGTAGSFDADGYTVGAYAGYRLTQTLTLDGLIAYTGSDYDNRVGTTTGSFDAHRITAAGHLKGRFEMGVATIEPMLGVMWASERQDAYTDSAAVAHAARTVTAGRLSLGPRISFAPVSTGTGEAFFWFATKGEYDFSNQGNSATTGLPDIDDLFSGRFQAGINATASNGISLAIQGDVSGLGSGEFIAYGGTVKLIVPLN